jgi:hypothetical protein
MRPAQLKGFERFPYVALVITVVFAIQISVQNGMSLSMATSTLFWGEAIAVAPLMRATGMADATTNVQFAAMIAIIFIVLAFVETAVLIVLRRASARVRWLVRAVAGVIVIGLLLFTPQAPPMRLF